MPSPETIFFALAGGILPALLWLWFWLQEDRLHPEPRGMIIRTFFMGMVAVPLVLPFEQLAQSHFCSGISNMLLCTNGTVVIFLWCVSEEIFKWLAAYVSALRTPEYDEPIDAVIYLLTAALGFAALENTFFLLTSISQTTAITSLITGNLRFIGATLLHVLASGTVGYFIALSFSRGRFGKVLYFIFGLALAILLHTLFNLYIMRSEGTQIFIVFCFVWVAILLLITGFEKVKRQRTTYLN